MVENEQSVAASKVVIGSDEYNVVKSTSGHCDGCDFLHYEGDRVTPCPGIAIKCCINGNILKK